MQQCLTELERAAAAVVPGHPRAEGMPILVDIAPAIPEQSCRIAQKLADYNPAQTNLKLIEQALSTAPPRLKAFCPIDASSLLEEEEEILLKDRALRIRPRQSELSISRYTGIGRTFTKVLGICSVFTSRRGFEISRPSGHTPKMQQRSGF